MDARHVLWLAEGCREVQPLERFWVPAGDPELARLAVISSGLRGDILVRIAGALACDTPPQWITVAGDHVLMNSKRMYETWTIGEGLPRGASPRSVGLACAALAKASRCAPHQHTGGPRLHAIDRDLIDYFAEKVGV